MANFSRRTAWNLEEDDSARLLREARAAGRAIADLTLTNPTRCGFYYDPALLEALRDLRSRVYDPDPMGLLPAREAVSAYYADHGANVSANRLLLTTSTSEAYSFLFRLLADPGDEILIAQPGYPLFDYLAALDSILLTPYPLFFDHGWWIDFAELERRRTPRTRAVVVVHPANPTGHATSAAERRLLEDFCARHGLALIVDEVFLDYSLADPILSFAVGERPCLTFVVSGLSKIAALPQMKCGWMAVLGPEELSRQALARLEVVADTFLSMNAPVQHALPVWLAARHAIHHQIVERVQANMAFAACIHPLGLLPVQAGWSGILRLPQRFTENEAVARLLVEQGVAVHPGSFYGLARAHFVVISLIVETETFRRGIHGIEALATYAPL